MIGDGRIGSGIGNGINREKSFWIPADHDANTVNMRTQNVIGSGLFRFNVYTPIDFVEAVSLKLKGSALANFTNQSIFLDTNYYGPTENINQHVESDHSSLYSGVINTDFEIDLLPVFSQLAARDKGGVAVDHKGIGTTVRYEGAELIYIGRP
jgi:hypothetical protein